MTINAPMVIFQIQFKGFHRFFQELQTRHQPSNRRHETRVLSLAIRLRTITASAEREANIISKDWAVAGVFWGIFLLGSQRG